MSRGRLAFVFLSLTILLLMVSSMLAATNSREEDDGEDSRYKYLSVFTEVLGLVKRAYVEETPTDSLLTGAFEGTADALDPFSLYIAADELPRFLESRDIGTSRSGLVVLKERGVAYVLAVAEGSPAALAGIEQSDVLSLIQGKNTREISLVEIRSLLAGAVGTEIVVERIRLGQKKEIRFTLAEFQPQGVILESQRGVAALRIGSFRPDTPTHVEESLRALKSGTAQLPGLERTDRLLVDLRGVAGEGEDIAYRIAGLFARGELGALTAREKTLEVFKEEAEPRWQGEMVVLIDRATQGAAEVLASVLHQSVEAKLVGERSFGHSGRQSLVSLSNGSRLQITDAFFTGPDRDPIDSGLEPDLPVRTELFEDEEEPAGDPILERGLEELLDEEEPVEKLAA